MQEALLAADCQFEPEFEKEMKNMNTCMRRVTRLGLILLLTMLASSVASQHATADADDRGRLLGSELIRRATRDEVTQGLATIGWVDVSVKSGIALYRIVYATVDAHGAPTVASGLLALPTDVETLGVVVLRRCSHLVASRWSRRIMSVLGFQQGHIPTLMQTQRRARRRIC